MSDPPTGPSDSEPRWTEDVSTAFTAAMQVAFERRLAVFLTALSTETLRLIASESKEWGEALTKATICVRALLTGGSRLPRPQSAAQGRTRSGTAAIPAKRPRNGVSLGWIKPRTFLTVSWRASNVRSRTAARSRR